MNRRRLPALLLALLLSLVALAAARPPTEDDQVLLPPDADNVEIHQVQFVNGILQEDHPVIMYKEDFVTEDFDPAKNGSSSGHHKKHRRAHRHHAEPQTVNEGEKILFDVLPDKPIVLKDDLDAVPVSNLEATQLVTPVKEEWLRKLPKKYHSRQRRSAYGSYPYGSYPYGSQQPLATLYYIPRLPVAGKKPQLQGGNPDLKTNRVDPNQDIPVPDDIGSRLDLEHNSNPNDADFSQFDNPRPPRPSNSGGSGGGRGGANSRPTFSPSVQESEPSQIFGGNSISRPDNRPTTRRPQPSQVPTTAPKVTNCVWAIVNCCDNGSKRIRYSCFEAFGCHGAFWGINPCADEGVLDADDLVAQAYPLSSFTPPASAPQASAPRPSFRQDTLQFPQEQEQQAGSQCQRASKYCCGLRNIASLYDCYQKQGCNDSLSDIISGCS